MTVIQIHGGRGRGVDLPVVGLITAGKHTHTHSMTLLEVFIATEAVAVVFTSNYCLLNLWLSLCPPHKPCTAETVLKVCSVFVCLWGIGWYQQCPLSLKVWLVSVESPICRCRRVCDSILALPLKCKRLSSVAMTSG